MDGKDLLPINQIICGDNLEVMRTWPDACVDAIVTDPPYGLSFMGKKWDYDVPGVECWQECLRVLKPGGHLLAFAGTRTQHRMAVRIEDAGFEIRDMIAWVYGSGFPKSLDVGKAIDKAAGAERGVVGEYKIGGMTPDRPTFGANDRSNGQGMGFRPGGIPITAPATEAAKQWDGWGSALKPAMEMITMARKALDGTIAGNVLKHGVGGINVDGCRVGTSDKLQVLHNETGEKDLMGNMKGKDATGRKIEFVDSGRGRFPANFCHDGSDEVVGLFPEAEGGNYPRGGKRSKPSDSSFGVFNGNDQPSRRMGDSGSAARFFKTCEMSAAERLFYTAKASKADRGGKNNHPTVKPVALMRYLVRLVTPPDGVVLDPFAGSGTTLKAAMLEHFRYIGIEISEEYCEITTSRLRQKQLF